MDLPCFTDITELERPKIPTTSRYVPDFHLTDGSNTYLPSRRRISVPRTAEDFIFTIPPEMSKGRLDTISFKFYKTVELWWAIAEANPGKIRNPLRVEAGTVIRIPPVEIIFAVLFP